MKIILLVFSLALLTETIAQEMVINLDENGKYIFSEIIDTPGISAEKLNENGINFMEKISKTIPETAYLPGNDIIYSIINKGNFGVHDFGTLKKHIAGTVAFDMTIEIKEEKYRYIVTNFIFTPYERNRYGKFVPVSGKNIPLEEKSSRLNRKNKNHQRKEVYTKTLDLIQSLNEAMVYVKKEPVEKVKKDATW